ncbi:Ig-like domain-containing protein [Mongoliibacter ruber]|uniref:Ig-like protein group 2 n=1 Tax=Mongoliibacter ruber TaxID=1750599 RepID=A0A2T0WVW0_9BACT|nr:Ig-like domain-containing protein [Mongoliibacter ruber]PRY90831.1 Ig-like protein group 2 [Mongoliibacter ruber]
MKNSFRSQAKLFLLIALVSLSSGICSSEDEGPELPVASTIEMEFPKSELTVGQTINLSAKVKDNLGNLLNDQPLIWETSNPEVLSVDVDGVAEAKSPGRATVEVKTQSGVRTSQDFIVIESIAEPHSFEVEPAEINIEQGEKVQIEMTVFDIEGIEIENPQILYKSYDEQICIVDETGLVEGLRPGSTKIHIEVSNKFTEIPVTVSSEDLVVSRIEVTPQNISANRGDQVQFSAKAFDQYNQEMPDVIFDWRSSNGCIASNDDLGLTSAYTPGNARITASVGDISAYGTISVLKSEVLEAETFEGTWNMCIEETGNHFAKLELVLEESSENTRNYSGEITLSDGSKLTLRGDEFIPNRRLTIGWSQFIQVSERTSTITNGKFIDEFSISGRFFDAITLVANDVRLSKVEE